MPRGGSVILSPYPPRTPSLGIVVVQSQVRLVGASADEPPARSVIFMRGQQASIDDREVDRARLSRAVLLLRHFVNAHDGRDTGIGIALPAKDDMPNGDMISLVCHGMSAGYCDDGAQHSGTGYAYMIA